MYSAQIFHISLRLLRNRADAEDNVQNVLWKAYGNIRRFEGRSRFSTWLFRIAVNEALMRIRGRGPEYLTLDVLKPEDEEAVVPDICDSRPETGLRLGPHFFNSDDELRYAVEQIVELSRAGARAGA